MRKLKRDLVPLVIAALGITFSTASYGVQVLFAHVDTGGYNADGYELGGYVDSLAGYNVVHRFLHTTVYNDYANFDQIWVYDLYGGTNKNTYQLGNYAAIGDWYNARASSNQNLIADGRMISSAWANEATWIQGYATELNARGGGLVLGTDHDYYVSGINEINAAINIDPFHGTLGTSNAIVDPQSPLYNGGAGTYACGTNQCVYDQSSPGYAPAGLQVNGQTLTPVAYHGTTDLAWDNAAISSTMGSRTFGTCGNPGQPPCDAPEPTTLAILGLGLAGIGFSRRKRLS